MKMLKWLTVCFAIILLYSGNVYAQVFLDFEVSKECIDHEILFEGDPVFFEIAIANTGNVDMDFMVEDPKDPSVDGMYFIPAFNTLTIVAEVPTDGECSDDGIVSNEVTVQPYIGGEPVLDPITVATDGCPVLCPGFDIEKVCVPNPLPIEDDIAFFEIYITNTGEVDLDFLVEDPAAGISDMFFISAGETLIMVVEVPVECSSSDYVIVSNEVTVTPYLFGEPVLDPLTASAECWLLCESPCDSAIVIPSVGTQIISGNTSTANNDAVPSSSCAYSPSAPDDLYVFTLDTETMVTASRVKT